MQYGMIIDLERCVGCHACTIACLSEWEVPVEFHRNWVYRLGPSKVEGELASTYYPGLCNHCTKPPCVDVCPADPVKMTFTDAAGKTITQSVAATWKDPVNGTVQIDKSRCLGCGACVEVCPYDARYINPAMIDDVGDGKADKCTYCMPRVEAGLLPACVQTCITNARIFGDLDDPNSEVARYVKKGAKGLEPKGGNIGPNSMYYGRKKDISLLFRDFTPAALADVNAINRRTMLTTMVKPAMRKAQELGLLGLAGTMLVQGRGQDEDKKKG